MVSAEHRAARRGDENVVVTRDLACRPRGSMLDINGPSVRQNPRNIPPCHFLRLRLSQFDSVS